MNIALEGNNKVNALYARRDMEHTCPFCKKKVFVKRGSIKTPHFSHFAKDSCLDTWSIHYDMSEWHMKWQNYFPIENQEITLTLKDIKHRADVIVSNRIIEFQNSKLTAKHFEERNNFYSSVGNYRLYWLFNIENIIGYDVTTKPIKKYDYLFISGLSTFNNFNSAHNPNIEIYFQYVTPQNSDDISIIRVEVCSKYIFRIIEIYTEDKFKELVGLTNGKCDSPILLDESFVKLHENFINTYPIKLNLYQQRTLLTTNGISIAIGVADSGKTECAIAYVSHLLKVHDVSPQDIIVVTSNDYYRKNIGEYINNYGVKNITIRELCREICNTYMDYKDKKYLNQMEIKKLLATLSLRTGVYNPKNIKNMRYVYNKLEEYKSVGDLDNYDALTDKFKILYNVYTDHLKKYNMLDIWDDFLYARELTKQDTVQQYYKSKYFIIEDAQHLTPTQLDVICSLINNALVTVDVCSIFDYTLGNYDCTLINELCRSKPTCICNLQICYTSNSSISKYVNIKRIQKSELRCLTYPDYINNNELECLKIGVTNCLSASIDYIALDIHQEVGRLSDRLKYEDYCVVYNNVQNIIPLIYTFKRLNIPCSVHYRNTVENEFMPDNILGKNIFEFEVLNKVRHILKWAHDFNNVSSFKEIYNTLSIKVKRDTMQSIIDSVLRYNGNLDEMLQTRLHLTQYNRIVEAFKFLTQKPCDDTKIIKRYLNKYWNSYMEYASTTTTYTSYEAICALSRWCDYSDIDKAIDYCLNFNKINLKDNPFQIKSGIVIADVYSLNNLNMKFDSVYYFDIINDTDYLNTLIIDSMPIVTRATKNNLILMNNSLDVKPEILYYFRDKPGFVDEFYNYDLET